jgi:hypothetical protein
MAEATRENTTNTSEISTAQDGDAALVEAVKDIAVCDDEINKIYRLYGDAYEDREDRKTWEERREANIAVLVNRPATSTAGLRAKAEAMQLATIAEDYESCPARADGARGVAAMNKTWKERLSPC